MRSVTSPCDPCAITSRVQWWRPFASLSDNSGRAVHRQVRGARWCVVVKRARDGRAPVVAERGVGGAAHACARAAAAGAPRERSVARRYARSIPGRAQTFFIKRNNRKSQNPIQPHVFYGESVPLK